ncbi:HD domain-containing protein [Methanosalsum zhilinae]|nr:HD domain-containing protein [Methanosalsum zhilinae]
MSKPMIIHDPVHRTVILNDLETALINTPQIQRLRKIQQLGLADLVYPGANHTRFEHSIGTMQTASIIGSSLGLDSVEIEKLRIAGLLHDIGHAAFSHAVEDVLKRNPELQPEMGKEKCMNHEAFTRYIIRNELCHHRTISAMVEDRFDRDAVIFFDEISKIATGETDGVERPYLSQIISGDIDADRIDFLLRDSYHTGVSLGLIDVDQIVQSLTIKNDRLMLGDISETSYAEDMVMTAAESMLIARAHHYTAIIHHPRTQAARVMLLHALEDAISNYRHKHSNPHVTDKIIEFFTVHNDDNLLNFIRTYASAKGCDLVSRIESGNIDGPAVRFNQKTLSSVTRMALSTIARHGVACKMFETEFSKELDTGNMLIDLSVATGVPKTMRFVSGNAESFLYDESALANGLVRAISRQMSLTAFIPDYNNNDSNGVDTDLLEAEMVKVVRNLSPRLLRFIRKEQYLSIEGLILLFYGVHSIFEEINGDYISIPRLRNITWIYRTVREFGKDEILKYLFDYRFHDKFGFPYSEKLFEDIQILVAMGMVDEDLRYYEKHGRIRQRYEYVLTSEGVEYSRSLVDSYRREFDSILDYIRVNQHRVPRDMLTLPEARYNG